jgi:NADH:ubiquinone oxidoreductase subunit 3 (subunit A)
MRFFKNPDGTLNPVNIFVLVTVITFLLLFLLCKSLIFDKKMITGYKDAPIDCGPEKFLQLFKERIIL